jgi:uncharacterized protein YjbJ (UPF0337 family)
MDKENIRGEADKASGAMKDAAGKVTGNDKLRAEGAIDKAKGNLRDGVGNAKDAIRKGEKDMKN